MANVEIVDHNTDYCLNIIWYVRFSFSLTLQVSFKPYLLFFLACVLFHKTYGEIPHLPTYIIIFCSMVHFRYVVHFCFMVLPEVVSVSFLVFFFLSSVSDPAVDRLCIFSAGSGLQIVGLWLGSENQSGPGSVVSRIFLPLVIDAFCQVIFPCFS